MTNLNLYFISNDRVYTPGFIGEHGNSILVESPKAKILFDTSQGFGLVNNAKLMDIDLKDLDSVVISHGHNDHIDGLKALLEAGEYEKLDIYGHEEIFSKRYKVYSDYEDYIGSSYSKEELEKLGGNFIFNDGILEISENIYLSGPAPRKYEDNLNKTHYKICNGRKCDDDYIDDQSLIIDTEKGLIILFGCAHAGVINTIHYVQEKFDKEIYGLFGGLHLLNSSMEKIKEVFDVVEDFGVEVIGFNHCTGESAINYFKENFKGKVYDTSTGAVVKL